MCKPFRVNHDAKGRGGVGLNRASKVDMGHTMEAKDAGLKRADQAGVVSLLAERSS